MSPLEYLLISSVGIAVVGSSIFFLSMLISSSIFFISLELSENTFSFFVLLSLLFEIFSDLSLESANKLDLSEWLFSNALLLTCEPQTRQKLALLFKSAPHFSHFIISTILYNNISCIVISFNTYTNK